MFNAKETIIKRIKAKNKSLIDTLKVLEIILESEYVIFRRKDSTTGRFQRIKYKYDSFYQLTHVDNWNEPVL